MKVLETMNLNAGNYGRDEMDQQVKDAMGDSYEMDKKKMPGPAPVKSPLPGALNMNPNSDPVYKHGRRYKMQNQADVGTDDAAFSEGLDEVPMNSINADDYDIRDQVITDQKTGKRETKKVAFKKLKQ